MPWNPNTEKNVLLRERNEAKFLADGKKKFSSKYSYASFEYVNAKTKGVITCPDHGDFLQNPDKHLNSIHPCPGCLSVAKKAIVKPGVPLAERHYRVTADMYLERLALPAHLAIDMTDFLSGTTGTVTVICADHGRSTQPPHYFLRVAFRCPGCGVAEVGRKKLKPFSNFLEKVKAVHGDKYSFPYPEEYEKRKSKLTVICPSHGVFSKMGQKLLSGQGCVMCRKEEMKVDGSLTGSYDERLFSKNPELAKHPAHVYYIRVGKLYKIGITRKDVKQRLRSIKSMAREKPELLDYFACSLQEAYLLEQTILKDFKLQRTYEMWSTEIFREDVMQGVSLETYFERIKDENE